MVCSSIIGACLRAIALTHTLTAVERRIHASAFVIPHDLFPGAEGAPGELFAAMQRRIRESDIVIAHDLFLGAEGAPEELSEAMWRLYRQLPLIPHP